MNKLILLLLFLFPCQKFTFAQNQIQGYDPFPQHSGPPFNDQVYDITFDTQNHPWVGQGYVNAVPRSIATYNGLTWDTLPAPTTIYNSYREVEFDRNDVLWLAGGAFFGSYDNGSWSVFDGIAIGLPTNNFIVSGLVVDKQNNKWFLVPSSPDTYLIKYDNSTFTLFNVTAMTNDTDHYFVNGLFMDTLDNIYITSPTADSVLKFDGTSFSTFDFFGLNLPAGYDIRSYAFDAATNNFWTLLSNNDDSLMLAEYVSGTWQFTPAYLPPFALIFSETVVDKFGKVWSCNGHGLTCFDGTGWQSWAINVASNYAFRFTTDYNGDLWICTEGDASGNTVHRFLSNSLHSIQGTVWSDANADGIIDATETVMPNIMVEQQPDGWVSMTSTAGHYQVSYSDSSQTYTLTCTPPMYWIQTSPISPVTVNPATQSTIDVNFGIAPIPGITDMSVFVSAANPRAGFTQSQNITYCNAGTDTISDTITYVHDPQLIYVSSNPPADNVTGDSLQWIFNNLQPLHCESIEVWFHLDSTAIFGDSLFSSVTIGPMLDDTIPSDNQFTLHQTVRGPFDPNEKSVYPEGDIQNGTRLYYSIFFQNVGNDTAFTVVVRDTLDGNLDLSSLRIEGSSHAMINTISDQGALEFRFTNILLADSNVNEPASHGFVNYSVVPKPNLLPQTLIENTASIYFDFNQPVVTNTTQTLTAMPDAIEKITNRGFSLYPNPATDVITIFTSNDDWKASLHNLLGEELMRKNFKGNTATFDVKDLPSGIYVLRIVGNGVLGTEKFIKH